MQAPLRLLDSLRPSTEPGLVLSTAIATVMLISTPLLLPAIAEEFDVSAGTAGLFSGVQLGAFVVGSWASGRFVTAGRGVFVTALGLLATANAASAGVDDFGLLLATRAAAGLALGVLTWLAWSQAFGDADRVGDLSVVGPLAGVVAAPLLGLTLEHASFRWVFVLLAAAALIPLARVPTFEHAAVESTDRHRPVTAALLLVIALGLVTLGASSVFVFSGVIAVDEVGMTPLALSFVLSANAAASIPSARWRGPRPLAGMWIFAIAGCAVMLGLAETTLVFAAVVVVWGALYWFAIPGVFALLSDRSRHPAERAGDAQAAMAAGRVVGPLVGGLAVNAGSFTVLGAVGGSIVAVGGAIALAVEVYRPAAPSASLADRPVIT